MAVRNTKISWSDSTWNAITGCSKVSSGCLHCYAEAITRRFSKRPFEQLHFHQDRIAAAAKFKPIRKGGVLVPRMVFVNSMSDLHHERVADEWVHEIYDAIERNPLTILQVLTKRPSRMRRFLLGRYGSTHQLPTNLWVGVSVEDASVAKRLSVLRDIRSTFEVACLFVSVEPLIGPIDGCSFEGFDWILIGGESGPGARPMETSWLRASIQMARAAGAAIWFKQYGTARNNPLVVKLAEDRGLTISQALEHAVEEALELLPDEKGGATLDGETYRELPTAWHVMRKVLQARVSPSA